MIQIYGIPLKVMRKNLTLAGSSQREKGREGTEGAERMKRVLKDVN